MSRHNPIVSRRHFLATVAGSGISTALLRSSPLLTGLLYARSAEAQGLMPTRTVAIYVPGGGIHDFWAPSGQGAQMQLGPMSQGYEPVKTECNFLLNMGHNAAGHGRLPLLLKAGWNGDSYDVAMGKALGPDLPFTYVNLGVHSNGQGYLTKVGNTDVPFEDNPFNAFRLLFGNTGPGSEKTPILDAHAAAVQSIRQKLAGYEVQRMDEHLDAIAATQRRLDDMAGGSSCAGLPDDEEFPLTHETFSRQARLQADIAVAALRCNLTSSVSIGFGNHQAEFRVPELSYQGIYHQSHHGGSNGLPDYPYYTEMRRHLGSLSAYLIAGLRDAGILDSTVVLETTDMGHADLHGNSDVPFMLAGGGGRLRRGQGTPANGYDQHDLLHTAGLACGVTLPYGREIPGVLLG